jgi:hypothetical protein
MKLKSYKILDETINLVFDNQFKQIKYLKFTSKSNKTGELECNKTEIKFTKPKDSINVYKENCRLFIFYIKELDYNKCDYTYYINVNDNDNNENVNENDNGNNENVNENDNGNNENDNDNERMDIGIGLSKLFNGFEEEKTIEKKWQCVIKNRNIFANIKRKAKHGNTEVN